MWVYLYIHMYVGVCALVYMAGTDETEREGTLMDSIKSLETNLLANGSVIIAKFLWQLS